MRRLRQGETCGDWPVVVMTLDRQPDASVLALDQSVQVNICGQVTV